MASDLRRKRVASVPRRFRRLVQGTYDIVIGNPPYVRPHRLSLERGFLQTYHEVAQGQVDLYIPFLYRAIRGWVKQGGAFLSSCPWVFWKLPTQGHCAVSCVNSS